MDQKHYSIEHITGDHEHEPVVNHSGNRPFQSVLSARMERRTVMKGGVGAALASLMGVSALGLVGCSSDDDDDDSAEQPGDGSSGGSVTLGFEAVMPSTANEIVVPAGYTATVFLPWGTPITGGYPEFQPDGTNTGAQQEEQVGMHHDGMTFYPIDVKTGGNSSEEGLLVMNHEYIDIDALHQNGPTVDAGVRTVTDEVRKEIAAHGVSVCHIRKTDDVWDLVFGSEYNRRITGATGMDIRGPLRGHDKLVTAYSNDATATRGTLNNCSMGPTPWNTYLAAEENWHGYFKNDDTPLPREHARHGIGTGTRYAWETATGGTNGEYERFNATSVEASADLDYRHEPNTYGYMVEIDPFAPESRPQKRTALGRFGHEGVIFAPATEGEPVVCYSGDDSRFEYIYKFVSAQPYHADTASGDLLDEGTLYVARFNEDGTGDWLALSLDDADFVSAMNAAVGTQVGDIQFDTPFADQGEVLLNTRLAADIMGATPMDRPEWGAVDPNTGEVYFTLTNNTQRTEDQVNAANPNANNETGHIIRWSEDGGDYAATSFQWDIFVFAGVAGTETVVDGEAVVTLDESNIFNSPDGLWFDGSGRLWIQTDGSDAAPYQNNMMLAANPETREIKRFFVGPVGCEVTGVTSTPDQTSMFVGIQHPESWPAGSAAGHPRSSAVLVTKDDGGVIGA
ncbi:PhoX family protein [Marinobacter sp. LN3S78]|uniref:PhoX family protein n=1 Tax=Marinobacter sp. LN3S78 TaxID=3382300 RepID=UPI00387B2146